MIQKTLPVHDVTARKMHQALCVLLLVVAFVVGTGAAPLVMAFVGLVLLVGRFWWQADLFRQFVWRVLEPAGIVRRREVQEDHQTRRVARVLGGLVLLAGALLLALGVGWAWVPVAAIAVMIGLDALFDFCALCALTHYFRRLWTVRQVGAR